MEEIGIMDRVRIVRDAKDTPVANGPFGRVIMIADGTKCVVELDDGGGASVEVSQLAKVK